MPAVVDLAGMRDGIKRLGGDPEKINPLVPVDLVIDHSVQAVLLPFLPFRELCSALPSVVPYSCP